MKKWRYFVSGIAVGALAVGTAAFADKGLSVFVNGNEIDASQAYISDGSTYIPLRAVAEALGADVEWNEEDYSVSISSKSISKLKLEENEILKNPKEHEEEFKAVLEAAASSWNDNIVSISAYEKLSGDAKKTVEQILIYKFEFNNIPKALNDAFAQYWTAEQEGTALYNNLNTVFEIVNTDGVYSLKVK